MLKTARPSGSVDGGSRYRRQGRPAALVFCAQSYTTFRIASISGMPYIHHMGITLTPIRITLREAREQAGMTQVELAKAADIRQATISDIETGKSTRVDLPVLERLCKVLGVEPGDLLKRERSTRKK